MKNHWLRTPLNWWLGACLGAAWAAAFAVENARAALDIQEVWITNHQNLYWQFPGCEFEVEAYGLGLESGLFDPPGSTPTKALQCWEDGWCNFWEDFSWPCDFSDVRQKYPLGSYNFWLNGVVTGNLSYDIPEPTGGVEILSPSENETIPGTPRTFTVENHCTNCDALAFSLFNLDTWEEWFFYTPELSTSSVDFQQLGIIPPLADGEYLFGANCLIANETTQSFGGDSFTYYAGAQIENQVRFFVPEPALPWLQLGVLATLALLWGPRRAAGKNKRAFPSEKDAG